MTMYFLDNENKFPSIGPREHLLLGALECMGKLNKPDASSSEALWERPPTQSRPLLAAH